MGFIYILGSSNPKGCFFSESAMPFFKSPKPQKKIFHITILNLNFEFPAHNTVNSRFKTDLKLQIHLNTTFFLDDQFLDSLYKSFLNQTTLDLRKEKWTFLNREFTLVNK